MITFIVTKEDVTKTIQFSTEGTLLDLKKEIINIDNESQRLVFIRNIFNNILDDLCILLNLLKYS